MGLREKDSGRRIVGGGWRFAVRSAEIFRVWKREGEKGLGWMISERRFGLLLGLRLV